MYGAITTCAALFTLGASLALWNVRGKVDAMETQQVSDRITNAALSENVKALSEAVRELRDELRDNRRASK